jgi:cytosine deaminase
MLLRSATLLDGRVVDVQIERGHISSVAPAGAPNLAPAGAPTFAPAGAIVGPGIDDGHDLAGYLLIPGPADPHAHLDKAYTADRVPNPTGDLMGAVEAWIAYRPQITVEDAVVRGRAGALASLAHGVTAIRSHADVGEGIELRSLEALLAVREELAGTLHLELAALVSRPVTGVAGGVNRSLLRAALERGADLVGGSPHIDPDPAGALEFCLETAAEFGRPVDLHMDETLDPGQFWLPELARKVARGFPHPVTASHCVSMGMQPLKRQVEVAEAVAAAKIAVVVLPQTNLYLQGRQWETSPPRGLTAVRALLAAGATVAAGGDNVRDPFNPMGRGDPLETANLLVTAGHLPPSEAYGLVSAAARSVMGLPAVEVAPGFPADLLAVAGASLPDALATATPDRLVFSGGRLVARTRVIREVAAPRPGAETGSEAMAWR